MAAFDGPAKPLKKDLKKKKKKKIFHSSSKTVKQLQIKLTKDLFEKIIKKFAEVH